MNVNGVIYDKTGKTGSYRGIRIETAYGSESFKRFAKDADYLDEYKTQHLVKYWLWRIVSDCGRSLGLWALWSLFLAVVFGLFFIAFQGDIHVNNLDGAREVTKFTYIYYSVVTFTTLGFGGVTPTTWWGELMVMAEVICGYVMLGGLLAILANKLARRS